MTCQHYGSILNTDESKSNRYRLVTIFFLGCSRLPFVLPPVLRLRFVFPPSTLSYPSFPLFCNPYTPTCASTPSIFRLPCVSLLPLVHVHLVLIHLSSTITFIIVLPLEFYTRLDPIFTPQLHLNSILPRTVLHRVHTLYKTLSSSTLHLIFYLHLPSGCVALHCA